MYSDTDQFYILPEQSILDAASGQFAKRVAIVVLAEPDFPGNRSFLTKVLAAAQLHLEQDSLYAEITNDTAYSFLPLIKEKHTDCVLVFGLSPNQLGIGAQIQPYQVQPFYGVRFLFADRLSVLEPDKVRKTRLWQALQQMFLLSP